MIPIAILNKNILIYGIIATVVVAGVAYLVSSYIISNYSVVVGLSPSTTNTIYPYQTTYFTITVNNTGTAPIYNLILGFYLGGSSLQTYKVSVPASKSVSIAANYTFPSNGAYNFQVIADPSHVLSIQNRQSAQSSLSINVSAAQKPDVYMSLPNTNVQSTQSFSLSGLGAYSAAAIADTYNVSIFSRMFGPGANTIPKIFENVLGYLVGVNGVYIKYQNGSVGYAAWLQGTVTPRYIGAIISVMRAPQSNYTIAGKNINLARIDNRTSVCVYYENGWTKILSYYNGTNGGTCLNFAGMAYTSNQTTMFASLLKTNATLTHYQSGFLYTNSSYLGSTLTRASGSLGVSSFTKNRYGIFMGYVRRSGPINISSANLTCPGVLFSYNGVSICSTTPAPKITVQNITLINTTEVTSNYTFSFYSLVNRTQLVAAYQNAIQLLNALSINQTSARWNLQYKNTCYFTNQSLGCTLLNFSYGNNTASLRITNKLGSPVRINNIACFIPGLQRNMSVGQVLSGGANATIATRCLSIGVPQGAKTRYNITIGYTLNNINRTAMGFANITTPSFG